MADIISGRDVGDEEIVSLIELLFFAYRDFTSDPDAILAEWGFGRAHHRVVHFVGRNPGMTVAQLLGILGITKQSLGRVLRDLIEKDLVYQRPGDLDRRQRLLFLTREGEALRLKLMAPQGERIIRALSEAGEKTEPSYRTVLYHLISPENRRAVSDWLKSRAEQTKE
ncbi:MarR family winged helix-turn-helix transcriptional regulator [Taklimakanibacter lacteus]|uniref:MarR family winged helix-turn-helix transcriptional regulator n=1 Tax=Taklimakanibacter lacteus TaxID=2268456 RepID=UPI000E6601BE